MSDIEYPETRETFFESLNGTQLYWEWVGIDSDQPPLVFLHGLGDHSATFQSLSEEFFTEMLPNHSVIYLDQRGCGRSDALQTDTLTLDTLVEDLEAVRQFLEIEIWIPLGHAFGGLVALEYARRYPQHTDRVIVVNPWVHYPELALTFLQEASAQQGISVLDPAERVHKETPQGMYPQVGLARIEAASQHVPVAELFRKMQFKTTNSRLQMEFLEAEHQLLSGAQTQRALIEQGLWEFEYPAFLSEIEPSVYVIGSLYDKTCYPNQIQWTCDLAEAPLYTIDAGHFPWLDDAEQFISIISEILEIS